MIKYLSLLGLTAILCSAAAGAEIILTPGAPGALFKVSETPRFQITRRVTEGTAEGLDSLIVRDAFGHTVETLAPPAMTMGNHFSAEIRPATKAPGYYELVATTHDAAGTNQFMASFAIIPDIELRAPDEASPFGVATHYARANWRQHPELPALQQKLGIPWFREEIDYKRSARNNARDGNYEIAQAHSLMWLPLLDYIPAKNGVLTNGIYRWDEDIAQIEKCFELHRGLFKMYELQNEPNNFGGWTKQFPGPSPKYMADNWGKAFTDLGKAVRHAMTEADPQAGLLWPDLDNPDWINKFSDNWGAAPFIDGVSPHPYSLRGQVPEEQVYFTKAGNYQAMLAQHGIPYNLWISELGYSTYSKTNYHEGMIAQRPLPEADQASWLVRAFLSHLNYGVKRMFYYDFYEDNTNPKDPEGHYGLLRHDTCQPKPAVIAYANLIFHIRQATLVGRIKNQPAGTDGYVYDNRGQPLLIVWRLHDAGDYSFKTTATSLTVFDLYGGQKTVTVKDGSVTLPIGTSPIYVTGMTSQETASLSLAKADQK